MTRPFLLYLDACVRGPVAEGLLHRGWDLVRAVDLHGEAAKDPPLFEHAAALGRVFITNDGPLLALAIEWLEAGRPFRMIFWPKPDDECYAREEPFRYPIHFLKPKA